MDISSYPRYTQATIVAHLGKTTDSQTLLKRLESIEKLIPFLEAAADDREWCTSHREISLELLNQAHNLTLYDSAMQRKITHCSLKIHQQLSQQKDALYWLQKMIKTNREPSTIIALMEQLKLSEEEWFAIAEFIILQIRDDDSTYSLEQFTHLASSFFHHFRLKKEETRLQLALNISMKGSKYALFFLAKNLPLFHLSEKSRLQVASSIAELKRRISGLIRILPLGVVITHIERFDLPEKERLRFAQRFLAEVKSDEWPLLIDKFDKIAPSHPEERVNLLKTLLKEGGALTLSVIVDNIERLQLPQTVIHALIMEIVEEGGGGGDLIRHIELFELPPAKLHALATIITERGSEFALVGLARAISQFGPLTEEERVHIATTIARRGEQHALYACIHSIERFQLSQEVERLHLVQKFLERGKQDPRLIAELMDKIDSFHLSTFFMEEEKEKIVHTFLQCSSFQALFILLKKINSFMMLIKKEEKRVEFAIAILKKIEAGHTYLFSEVIPQLQLSEDSFLHLLHAMAERRDGSFLEIIASDLPRYTLSPNSTLALRLRLLITIAVHGDPLTQKTLAKNINHLYLYEEEILPLHPPEDEDDDENSLSLLRKCNLSLTTLDLVAELFSPSIHEAFCEEIALVKEIILAKTKLEEKAMVTSQLISLLLYAMEKMRSNDLSAETLRHGASLLKALLEYRNPEKRDHLFLRAIDELPAEWSHFTSKIANPSAMILAFILFPRMEESAELKQFFLDVLQKERRFLKDGAKKNSLIVFLLSAVNEKTIRGKELAHLLKLIFQTRGHGRQLAYIHKIDDLITYRQIEEMKKITLIEDVDTLLEQLFQRSFHLGDIESFKEKYERTFGCFRQRQALLTYGGKVRKFIKESSKGAAFAQLQLYVHAVLDGTFQELRYRKENNPHLRMVFEGRKELKRRWIKGEMIKADTLESGINPSTTSPPLHPSRLTVVDTDDPNDLLLMGTEIHGSCQNVHGSHYQNICLLSYLLDGKNRMIAVKNPQGKLIGRCVIRLLWDGYAPLLFREKFYINHNDSFVHHLLHAMSLRRAKALQLPLLVDDGKGVLFPRKVHSLGGPTPFEYVDARTDHHKPIAKRGIYSLASPTIIDTNEVE